MRKKGGALSRRVERRDARPQCIIFCEGKNTEPDYFRAFQTRFPRSLFRLELIGAAGTPAVLLDKAKNEQKRILRAKKRGNSYEENDRVWIVFDRDEHPYVDQTIFDARANGIGLAYSNPCFELWLILHSTDHDRPDHRHDVQRRCEEVVEGYDRNKRKTGNMLAVVDRVQEAELRAALLVRRREEEGAPLSCPSSTVYDLTSSLRDP